jgi:phosphopantetheine--protein transferase-like protein
LTTRAWIGNDIVDLAEPGVAGKEQDTRFMDRVFTPEERARILEAAAPTIALWKTWAAKEAAYKIACKLRDRVVFAHRAFEVAPGTDHSLGTWAQVSFDGLEIRVRWETARDYIHCVGQLIQQSAGDVHTAPRAPRQILSDIVHHGQMLCGTLTTAEQASVHSTPSARVRLVARRLFERWELQGAEVLRQWREEWGWSPPVVALEGQPLTGFDVSLSHDGRFVAASVVGPA